MDLTKDPREEANIDRHPWYKALRDQTRAVVPKKEWYSFFSSHGSKPSLGGKGWRHVPEHAPLNPYQAKAEEAKKILDDVGIDDGIGAAVRKAGFFAQSHDPTLGDDSPEWQAYCQAALAKFDPSRVPDEEQDSEGRAESEEDGDREGGDEGEDRDEEDGDHEEDGDREGGDEGEKRGRVNQKRPPFWSEAGPPAFGTRARRSRQPADKRASAQAHKRTSRRARNRPQCIPRWRTLRTGAPSLAARGGCWAARMTTASPTA